MNLIKDILAQTDLALAETYNHVDGFYFVSAYTDTGTRFYSEPIATFESAEKMFNDYTDVIEYFKGGTITLYKINSDDYDVIAYIRI